MFTQAIYYPSECITPRVPGKITLVLRNGIPYDRAMQGAAADGGAILQTADPDHTATAA